MLCPNCGKDKVIKNEEEYICKACKSIFKVGDYVECVICEKLFNFEDSKDGIICDDCLDKCN